MEIYGLSRKVWLAVPAPASSTQIPTPPNPTGLDLVSITPPEEVRDLSSMVNDVGFPIEELQRVSSQMWLWLSLRTKPLSKNKSCGINNAERPKFTTGPSTTSH